MLLTRDEMTFDFQGATFDLERDKTLLGWILSQALFGESTGCYCGAALYAAPDVAAATFLSRQALEEFQHFKQFLGIFQRLGIQPVKPHPIMKFLTTHETLWDHHVTLEMAVGEGLVLTTFYALIDTMPDPEIRRVLQGIARQEATHVQFGEERAMLAIRGKPWLARQLLGLNLISLDAARLLGGTVAEQLAPKDHPVLRHLPEFVGFVTRVTELRLTRMGILTVPLEQISSRNRLALMAEGVVARRIRSFLNPERAHIPDNYLDDPMVKELLGARA